MSAVKARPLWDQFWSVALRAIIVIPLAMLCAALVVVAYRIERATQPRQPVATLTFQGWARAVGGQEGGTWHRPGPFSYEVLLEDGRRLRHRSRRQFGGIECVTVRVRKDKAGLLRVVGFEEPTRPCRKEGGGPQFLNPAPR